MTKNIFNTGISKKYSEEKNSKIIITNKLSLALSLVIFFASILLYFISNDTRVFIYLTFFALISLITILINKYHFHILAKIYSAFIYNFIIFFFSCLFGEKSYAHVNFIVFVAYPFLVFDSTEKSARNFSACFSIAGFILLELSDYSLFFSLNFSEQIQEYFRSVITFIVTVENFIVISLFVVVIETTNKELHLALGKSETLLLNILPSEIAEELKQKGSSEAKQHDNISVLFTDFVNFTGISETTGPKELVAEIDTCFRAFDEITDRNGLEKIKTIGDAYLAVCGLPNENMNHAINCTKAAKDIIAFMQKRKQEGGLFEIRIGINSGSVVAGIVGIKKYAYDIWGDTVNTAARMEQNSETGKINISGNTRELIKNDFECIYRGKIEAKNKGMIDMYFVN